MRNKSRHKDSQGSIAVIVCFSMVAVIGLGALVLDGGQLYLEKARLQNAVDAAALAGVRMLQDGAAVSEQVAQETALANGAASQGLVIAVLSEQGTVSVQASSTVSFGLARVLNITESQVWASATAQASGVTGMRGAAPLGVIWQEFIFGQQYDLKVGAGDSDTGNYGALALGDTGSANYRDNLQYGYPEWIRAGDLVPTEPGNMAGPTEEAIVARLAGCNHFPSCNFEQFVPSCSKILFVPIINGLPNGRGEVTIVGFASFFLEGQLEGEYIRGRFIETHVQGEVGGASTYGLTTIRLTH